MSQGESLRDTPLTFPNLLSLLRFLATPLIIALLLAQNIQLAFYVFIAAAITDFIDGWYAKAFKAQTRFGAFLDPLADKTLIISVYVWLGLDAAAPYWLVVLIVSRDLFILAGMLITLIALNKLWIAPLGIGKLTTLVQLVLAGLLLAKMAFANGQGFFTDYIIFWDHIIFWGIYIAAGVSALSVFAYAAQWLCALLWGQNEEGKMKLAEQQIGFWLALVGFLALALYFLGDIIAPFLAGFALAYVLDPLVDRLERIYIPRLVGAFIAILLAFSFVVGLFLLLAPILLSQLSSIVESLPSYMDWFRKLILQLAPSLDKLLGDMPSVISKVKTFLPKDVLQDIFVSVRSGGQVLFSVISFLVITPIVTLYLLRDWDRIMSYLDSLLPLQKTEQVRGVLREIDEALAASLRGLLSVCIFLAVFYGTALHLLGLDFGILIGIFSGLISFIPYAGFIFGFILALQVALFQFWPDWQWALLLCGGVFGVGQILESYILTPRLVGDKVGIHAVWIIFALMAFSTLWGFAGLLVALPSAAVIAVLLRHGIKLYQESDYYKK